ncbi:MAG: pantoate--beta-alanine ligase [Candidatus Symbiothrix sp.]|jgi:pantoate--beta-alanine ligase|nr:pantoate--beta-alanine ligase [Candidatus Symbiothrix sp.]
MQIFDTVVALQSAIQPLIAKKQSVGFVPTMGALHEGHLSLVRQMTAENEVAVVSIFVNPTQFNDKEDLRKYPRTLAADCALLQTVGDHILVFAPSVEEIYPQVDTRLFAFGDLESVMEGKFRPGHFNGVAQVVSRLFDIVHPTRAYFGEKDFQQLAIIRAMAQQLQLPVEIVAHPIVREADGLALSSRNTRLTPSQRQYAPAIAQTLFVAHSQKGKMSVETLKQSVVDQINRLPEMRVEYFELVDSDTLQSIRDWHDTDKIRACIAVFDGDVRLIDNIDFS